MALRSLFRGSNSLAIVAIDRYLVEREEESDRASGVNSPSQAGSCNRANYYKRTGVESGVPVNPRSERIFDNGDHVHLRIQRYLMNEGTLLMPEVPLHNKKYNIMGHTDGLLNDKVASEIVVLEIKSINSRGFSIVSQQGPKAAHKAQATVYAFCLEEHRKKLRMAYTSKKEFILSRKQRAKFYASLYQHLEDGAKYTREEKIARKVEEHLKADSILFRLGNPIHRVCFLYENKDTQELKEFVIDMDDQVLRHTLHNYKVLEECLKAKKVPKREGAKRSDPICKDCDYTIDCWN